MTTAQALALLERAETTHQRADWRQAARALSAAVTALQAAQVATQAPVTPPTAAEVETYQAERARLTLAAPVEPARLSLCDFLAERGLRPNGELVSRDLDRRHRLKPFRRRLIREDGIGLEAAAELAFDNGYFPNLIEAPDTDALLDAMERDLQGDFPALYRREPTEHDYWTEALEPEERAA